MKITRICQMNGRTYTMEINCTQAQLDNGYRAYDNGALLQNAFPFLTVDEREFLKTGTPPHVWEEMFSEKETLKFAPHDALVKFHGKKSE